MRYLVVGDRAVACRVSTYADSTGDLAGVSVSDPDPFTHLLPSLGTVPSAPLDLMVTLSQSRLLIPY
ncbi:hypothetical protein [Agrobacterium vitis]|uniref:hypothetical protein n=1 Tax=Agrobacterium vitis TaxID=373 RepID=UPI001572714E|nr:hypothetical protein [Agrobacterium vitis]NSZ52966.1 hypothetical protein [Agrobacterium vitis]NTA31725.1 hypothetical protein [Agrobacterium vitis]